MYYNANVIHPSSRTNRKRVYHNMKNLQSDRPNFDHLKGVKIFTLEKFYTRGANLHPPKYTHVPIFTTIGLTDFPGSRGRTYVAHRPCH